MKEDIADILWKLHIRTKWVHRNARLFSTWDGKGQSWEQLPLKEDDFPYYFKDGVDIYPEVNKDY